MSPLELYETCCEFLRGSILRKDRVRGKYWAEVAAEYYSRLTTEEQTLSQQRREARFVK